MKNRYSTNKTNLLVIKRKRKRIIGNGKFSVDRKNRLVYWLNEPVFWRRINSVPPKVTFEGKWQLDKNYDLGLYLVENKNQHKGDYLSLKGEIISVDKDSLVFQIRSANKQGQTHIHLLKLKGVWHADECSRISFSVERKDSPDILTFESVWQINENQQVVYHYEKTELKTKRKIRQSLLFKGFWQITRKDRLTYIISGSTQSRFDFRVQLESPNVYPQEGTIKYRIGVGLKGVSPKEIVPGIICLYGVWKFSRKAGISFQMDYGDSQIQSIKFSAELNLSKKDEITLSLINKDKKPLGINVIFTHRFLKKLDAETFLKLKKLKEEDGIETGIRIPF